MRALLGTEFAALLARADVSQAAFARLSGHSPRRVNNWCRVRAAVPPWTAALAVLLQDALSPPGPVGCFVLQRRIGTPFPMERRLT